MTDAAGTAKKTVEQVKAEAAAFANWADVVDSIPEVISPLLLPDDVQLELFEVVDRLDSLMAESGSQFAMMKDLVRVMPSLFKDADEYEAWRTTIPLSRRFETFFTIFQHYMEALGEADSSAAM